MMIKQRGNKRKVKHYYIASSFIKVLSVMLLGVNNVKMYHKHYKKGEKAQYHD